MSSPQIDIDRLADKMIEGYGAGYLRQFYSAKSPLEWAKQHRLIQQQPFSLRQYPCLVQIYQDDSPYIVIQKCAQMGATEFLINKALHAMDGGHLWYKVAKANLNVGYVFPTHETLVEFSKERIIGGVLEESDYLASLIRTDEKTKAGLKLMSSQRLFRVRDSYWHIRGAWNPSVSLKSFPIDMLIIDELDEASDRAVALAEKRLRASDLQHKIYVSTPTYPGVGINYYYNLSDQHVWQLQCSKCGYWQEPNFFDNVFMKKDGILLSREEYIKFSDKVLASGRFHFVCAQCHSDMHRLARGRWLATNQGSYIRGYRIPGLVAPKVSLKDLVLNSVHVNPAQIQEFYNSDLGLPYAPKGGSLSEEDLIRCELVGQRNFTDWFSIPFSTMGVDVGAKLHVKIATRNSQGYWETVLLREYDDFSELDDLFYQYKISACVVDAFPETRAAKEFANKWRGRVWLARYPNTRQLETARFGVDPDMNEVPVVDILRTEAMDEVAAAIVRGEERWPENMRQLCPAFYAHLQSPIKTKIEARRQDGSTEIRYTYVESGPDHFYHASVYERVARQKVHMFSGSLDDLTVARGDISPLEMRW